MVAASPLRRFAWRGQAGLGAAALRAAAVLVALLGVAASAWIARGWDATVTRQRDERPRPRLRQPSPVGPAVLSGNDQAR
jgi:hypothetical protein